MKNQFSKLMYILLFLAVIVFYTPTLMAHSAPTGEEPGVDPYLNILEKLGHLNIETDNSKPSMEAVVKMNYFPFFNIGGKKVHIDNAFWDLADEISRLYIKEIKDNCNECVVPSVEAIRQQTEMLVAKGWASSKALAISDSVTNRYVGEFAGLGARFGVVFGIAKVAGELVEDALLVIFKMPGAHFLCEAITATIAFYGHSTLTISRGLFFPKYFDSSRISMLVRMGVTSHYVKRALKRLVIEVPEFEIDEELLEEFKETHGERRLTYRITGRHRLQSFLGKLEKGLAKKRARIEELKNRPGDLSKKDQERLILAENEGIHTYLTIQKKVFDNYRQKKTFFLLKHKGPQALGQYAGHTSRLFRGTNFWFFELKNELFEPHVRAEAEKAYRDGETNAERALKELSTDPVTLAQLEQFSEPGSRAMAAHIFSTLDKIGDKNQKQGIRKLNFEMFEAFFGSVLPNLLNEIINTTVSEMGREERKFKTVFGSQWRAFRLSYYTDIFVDYIRYSAFDAKNSDPTRKYHIRDYAITVMQSYAGLSQFRNIETAEQLQVASAYIKEQKKILSAERFWVNKAHKPPIPIFPQFLNDFLGGAIPCEELYK